MPQRETRQVPAAALRFDAGPMQLQEVVGEETRRRFSIQARSADPIEHWWWGRLVHDFEGMTHKERIPIDYCHFADEVLGYGDEFTADENGLHVSGELVPFTDQDRASEILHKFDAGVPYEASIDFRGEVELEWIPEEAHTEVNGKRFDGPGLIVRRWPLRSLAVCPVGADMDTDSQFSRGDADKEVSVCLFTESDEMPKSTLTGKPQKPAKTTKPTKQLTETPETEGNDSPESDGSESTESTEDDGEGDAGEGAEASGTETAPESAAQQSASPDLQQARQDLQKFVAKFGAENGSKWFGEGKTFAESLDLHCGVLSEQISALTAERDSLKQRLSAVQLGETEPLAGGSTESSPAAPVSEDNYALAAAAINKRLETRR